MTRLVAPGSALYPWHRWTEALNGSAAVRAIRAARWIGMRQKNGLGRFTFEIRVRGIRVLSQLERRLSCHVPGFKSAHPAVPVTNTQLCIMHIMLNHVLCKGARVSVQSHIPPVKFPLRQSLIDETRALLWPNPLLCAASKACSAAIAPLRCKLIMRPRMSRFMTRSPLNSRPAVD